MTTENEADEPKEEGQEQAGTPEKPKKLWQWLLIYPAILGMFINTIVPPVLDLFKDKTKADKAVMKTEQQKLNKELFITQLECLETVDPAVYLNKSFKVKFYLRMCPSMYALIKIEAATNSIFKSGYKWIDFTDFKKHKKVTFNFNPFTNLYAYPRAKNRRKRRRQNKFILKKNKYIPPLCRSINKKVLSIVTKKRKKCTLKVINIYTGVELKRQIVNCKTACLAKKKWSRKK